MVPARVPLGPPGQPVGTGERRRQPQPRRLGQAGGDDAHDHEEHGGDGHEHRRGLPGTRAPGAAGPGAGSRAGAGRLESIDPGFSGPRRRRPAGNLPRRPLPHWGCVDFSVTGRTPLSTVGVYAAVKRPPHPREKHMLVNTFLASLAAKLAMATGLAVATVTAAGAAGVLPEPAQNAVASVVEATTPFTLPDATAAADEVVDDVRRRHDHHARHVDDHRRQRRRRRRRHHRRHPQGEPRRLRLHRGQEHPRRPRQGQDRLLGRPQRLRQDVDDHVDHGRPDHLLHHRDHPRPDDHLDRRRPHPEQRQQRQGQQRQGNSGKGNSGKN